MKHIILSLSIMLLISCSNRQHSYSDEQVAQWKTVHGEVYLVSFSEKENFIFRPIKRQEWNHLMTQIAKIPEEKKTEAIMMKAVVWPKLSDSNISSVSAGTPEALKALILEASNFIPPERAVQLVRPL